jgi:uncharacterized protein (TIGR02453 family)
MDRPHPRFRHLTTSEITRSAKTPMAKTEIKFKPAKWSFPPDTVQFLHDLAANNNRKWFTENKSRYDLMVKRPAADFCDHITLALENLTALPHTSKVFRVHRDVRFSKDKTPYKAYLHMLFQPKDIVNAPKWFFGLEPDRLALGAGVFEFEKKHALEAYRRRVAGDDGKVLGRQLDKMRKAGIRLRDPELKRIPPGYNPEHDYADLLCHKGLSVWRDHPGGPDAAAQDNIIKTTTANLTDLRPLFMWLLEMSAPTN